MKTDIRSTSSMAITLAWLTCLAATPVTARTACEASAQLVGRCFWIHGRLGAWNGAPTFRIWRVGSHRILGVNTAANGGDSEQQPLPPEVLKATPKAADLFSTDLYGDYRVCPFTRSRPGRMQYVCIAKATRLIAVPR
jgi:hypothetical protein